MVFMTGFYTTKDGYSSLLKYQLFAAQVGPCGFMTVDGIRCMRIFVHSVLLAVCSICPSDVYSSVLQCQLFTVLVPGWLLSSLSVPRWFSLVVFMTEDNIFCTLIHSALSAVCNIYSWSNLYIQRCHFFFKSSIVSRYLSATLDSLVLPGLLSCACITTSMALC